MVYPLHVPTLGLQFAALIGSLGTSFEGLNDFYKLGFLSDVVNDNLLLGGYDNIFIVEGRFPLFLRSGVLEGQLCYLVTQFCYLTT